MSILKIKSPKKQSNKEPDYVPMQGIELSDGKRENGATMLEYSLLAALIALVAFAGVVFVGQQASQSFSMAGSGLASN